MCVGICKEVRFWLARQMEKMSDVVGNYSFPAAAVWVSLHCHLGWNIEGLQTPS